MTAKLYDLTNSAEDLARLRHFYHSLYTAGFPDANERESLKNMARYLELKREGWYGPNNYHICLLRDGQRNLAVAISDYLADANCGVIEFILVDEAARGQGLGRRMHEATLALLQADARRAGNTELDAVIIELNDPFKVPAIDDNFDPFARAMLWDGWGYGRLGFPYVQPALSSAQRPVTCLLLGAKPLVPGLRRHFPADLVRRVVEGYLIWAMRIPDPMRNVTFRRMAAYLAGVPAVPLEPLARYIGQDRRRPLTIRPVTLDDNAAFNEAMAIYQRAFPPGPTAVDTSAFQTRLQQQPGGKLGYHLWLIAAGTKKPAHGMASFFVGPHFGYCGYVALEPPLAGRGRAHVLMKRIEAQMIQDQPRCRGIYLECDPDSPQQHIFEHLGYSRVPIRYHQPRLDLPPAKRHRGQGPELALMYKPLGASYGAAPPSRRALQSMLAILLKEIYRLEEPPLSAVWSAAFN